MARAVPGLVTASMLALCVGAGPAYGQSPLWSDFSPRLLSVSDIPLATLKDDVLQLSSSPSSTSVPLGRWFDADSSVGLDVTRFRPDLGLSRLAPGVEPIAGTAYRFIDSNLQQTALSLDLKLVWPSRWDAVTGLLQPYLAFGPTLFFSERNPFANPLGTMADVAVWVGVKAGAGISWQIDSAAALFGEYRVTRGTDSPLLSSGGRLGPGNSASGFDLLYGVRFKF